MATVSKEEYLKRYMSGSGSDGVKKKRKIKKSTKSLKTSRCEINSSVLSDLLRRKLNFILSPGSIAQRFGDNSPPFFPDDSLPVFKIIRPHF